MSNSHPQSYIHRNTSHPRHWDNPVKKGKSSVCISMPAPFLESSFFYILIRERSMQVPSRYPDHCQEYAGALQVSWPLPAVCRCPAGILTTVRSMQVPSVGGPPLFNVGTKCFAQTENWTKEFEPKTKYAIHPSTHLTKYHTWMKSHCLSAVKVLLAASLQEVLIILLLSWELSSTTEKTQRKHYRLKTGTPPCSLGRVILLFETKIDWLKGGKDVAWHGQTIPRIQIPHLTVIWNTVDDYRIMVADYQGYEYWDAQRACHLYDLNNSQFNTQVTDRVDWL